MLAVCCTPGSARMRFSSVSGRSDLVRSVTSFWKSPKSARPTWIRSSAVLCTPAAIERSATISPTPIATPAEVRAVRPRRRRRFFQISPGHVTCESLRLAALCAGRGRLGTLAADGSPPRRDLQGARTGHRPRAPPAGDRARHGARRRHRRRRRDRSRSRSPSPVARSARASRIRCSAGWRRSKASIASRSSST